MNEQMVVCLPRYTGNSVRGERKFARFTFVSLPPRMDLVFVELEAYTIWGNLFLKKKLYKDKYKIRHNREYLLRMQK